MIELNDEVLSTYLDGEGDAQARVRIEEALAQDSGARARLERLRSADKLLRESIPEPAATAEDPLVRLILFAAPANAFARSSAARLRSSVALAALAAGLSGLAVGVIVSALLRSAPGTVTAPDLATAGLDVGTDEHITKVLDSLGSGEHLRSGQRDVSIVLSFRSRDGEYCRVFESSGTPKGGEGIACRRAGQWHVVAWDGTRQATGGFQPAGGSELIDGVMDRLGGKSAIEPAAERRLIDDEWKR